MSLLKAAALASLALLFAPPAQAKAPGQAPASPLAHEAYTLDNGLTVLLKRDPSTPMVAVDIWYHVGALHERPGRSGFAHLYEHMMFEGSEHVEAGEIWFQLTRVGAALINASTTFDRTNYFEVVPGFNLEMALWLESDRMGFLLDAVDQKLFEIEKKIVKNERRQRLENTPYGLADERAWKALFPAPHPLHHQVIGSMDDLEAATIDDVRAFYTQWYTPSNAVLTLVGNFELEETKALIQKYFGSLPTLPKPKGPEVTPIRLKEEVVIRHDETVATVPALTFYWHGPAPYAEGDAAGTLTAHALAGYPGARLDRALVREGGLATSVQAGFVPVGTQSLFIIQAVARPGVSTDTLAAAIDAELEGLRAEGISAAELQRGVAAIETQALLSFDGVGGLLQVAETLQGYQQAFGAGDRLAWDLQRHQAVTPAQAQAFAQTWLPRDRRVVLHAVPPSAAAPTAPTPAEPAAAAQPAPMKEAP